MPQKLKKKKKLIIDNCRYSCRPLPGSAALAVADLLNSPFRLKNKDTIFA